MISHMASTHSTRFTCVTLRCLLAVCFLLSSQPIAGQSSPQQPPDPKRFARNMSPPFALTEEASVKGFDSLPREEQEKKLLIDGPLLPEKSNLNNFSMRAFVRGNSPLFIDYAIEPNSTALVTISTDEAEYLLTINGPKSIQEEVRKIQLSPSMGDWRKDIPLRALELLIKKFLLKPEIARTQVAIDLPPAFGEDAQPGKISIQAFSNEPKYGKAAYFRLYGLAMGDKAITNASMAPRPERMAHHASSVFPAELRASTAFDTINLGPGTVRTARGENVRYEIHSRSAFNNVKVIFYRVDEYGDVSIPVAAHAKNLGPIVENGWLKPSNCRCHWDGKNGGVPSKGIHDLEVRGWFNLHGREWASAWSNPKRVRIN